MPPQQSTPESRRRSWPTTSLIVLLIPVLLATAVYKLDSYDPIHLPLHELTQPPLKAPSKNDRILKSSELVGHGQLNGPEDIAYDAESGVIYTGCADGWIKRITVNDSVGDMTVSSWVNTGGRPLGLALDRVNHDVIVADAYKGLLRVRSRDGGIELLTDEAEGVKFKLTDAVAIDAEDGSMYFTDASSEYSVADAIQDILGGKPNGRLLRYDPVTKKTTVLLRNLYFANGVDISPDQQSLVFCETPMKRCSKYYMKGEKEGKMDKFADNLPGLPDNIHYDGQGHYWIAFAGGITASVEFSLKQPLLRKAMVILTKYIGPLHMEKNSGVFVVDLEGKPVAHYSDPELSFITTGFKIGTHLYCGNLLYDHILRLDLAKHPAL
ncbi:Protein STRICTOSIDINE SYNTHASE-LIKE 7 [Linum grandiflorum]